MARTISGSTTLTQSVTTFDNPVYVIGTINATSGDGLDGTGAIDLTNSGSIAGSTFGISLGAGSNVLNQAGGNIASTGGASGVFIVGGGSLTNAGSISGLPAVNFLSGAGTVTNTGAIAGTGSGSVGIAFQAGGSIANEAGGSITGDLVGAEVAAGISTITNHGTIANFATTAGAAIVIDGGSISNYGTIIGPAGGVEVTGSLALGITNAAGAVMSSYTDAIFNLAGGGNVTVSNSGQVLNTGTAGAAINLYQNTDLITNTAGGLIEGSQTGIFVTDGSVINDGTVQATATAGQAVYLNKGGAFTNAAGAMVTGPHGVVVGLGQGTVVNAGTIDGTGGYALSFNGYYADRLVIDPTAVFGGKVHSSNTIGSSIVSTLELAAGTGTLPGIGTAITNFGSIVFDPGATWDVSGVLAGFAGSVSGFAPTDTIHLTDVVATSGTYASGKLNLYDNGTPVGQIAMTGNFATYKFTVDPTTGITVACFTEGTRIATPDGETAVEMLLAGQRLRLANGDTAPVRWLGHRRIDCRRHPRPWDVWPVRIAAHAFAPGMPAHELRLSPDHAVFADGVLVPIRYLVNGISIVQQPADSVGYWHVELDRHAVLLAGGLPCESYLDTGNRAAFANGGTAVQAHPDFARRVWAAQACAPLVCAGPELVALRARLLARLKLLGYALTDDPALRLLADDHTPLAPQRHGGALCVVLPDGAATLRLSSRHAAPAELLPDGTDTRRLGVALCGLWFDGVAVALADARLGRGWHAPEPGLRWTDGEALLEVSGVSVVQLRLATPGLRYAVDRRYATATAA
jgi:hypothetical protein